MEDNPWTTEAPWDVTNGLVVVELITGRLQFGDTTFEQQTPSEVNVAGDLDDPNGPTYAVFAGLRRNHRPHSAASSPSALIVAEQFPKTRH